MRRLSDPPTAPGADALVTVMVDAFADDPLYVWLHPEAATRRRNLRSTFELMVECGRVNGEVRVVGDRAEPLGAAIWTWPGQELLDDAGYDEFASLLRAAIGARADDALDGMRALAQHAPEAPHAVLHNICVHPGHRSAGLGRSLVQPLLAECDTNGVTVALESSNRRNLSFYRRLGFEAVAEVQVPGGGPTMWPMWRRPQADQPPGTTSPDS